MNLSECPVCRVGSVWNTGVCPVCPAPRMPQERVLAVGAGSVSSEVTERALAVAVAARRMAMLNRLWLGSNTRGATAHYLALMGHPIRMR